MSKPHILIGVAGGTASGKSSVVKLICDAVRDSHQVVMITQDSYYKNLADVPMLSRMEHNFDHPDAFDSDLLVSHLKDALAGRTFEMPTYDHTTHCRRPETTTVGPHKVILLEGILILADPRLRDLMDIRVFIDTDADVRLTRRLRRDIKERGRTVDSVLDQYEHSVRPMHEQFVEPSKRHADVIIPHGVENRVGVDLLMTKIRTLLSE